jgi:hypothetical protein
MSLARDHSCHETSVDHKDVLPATLHELVHVYLICLDKLIFLSIPVRGTKARDSQTHC